VVAVLGDGVVKVVTTPCKPASRASSGVLTRP